MLSSYFQCLKAIEMVALVVIKINNLQGCSGPYLQYFAFILVS